MLDPGPRAKTTARLGCEDDPDFIEGIRLFNERLFFECHEALERVWMREQGAARELCQGTLQVGVGFYHLERGNYRGAMLCLERGIARLRTLPSSCCGIAVGALLEAAELARRRILQLGERWRQFDRAWIPTIRPSATPTRA